MIRIRNIDYFHYVKLVISENSFGINDLRFAMRYQRHYGLGFLA